MVLFLSSDVSSGIWNEVALNEEDLSYMLDETTPVKACGDLAYHVNHNGMVSSSLFALSNHKLSIFFNCKE